MPPARAHRAPAHRSGRRSGPGRSRAGSIRFGRFVAAITTTPCNSSSPSISARIVLTTRSVTAGSPRPPPRDGRQESISSMKITAGATWRARAKRRETCCSDSPYHLDRRSDDLVATKFASASRATAFASRVLPVPGGPKSRKPLAGRMPRRRKASGCLERQLDALAQRALRLLEAADVVPGRRWAPGS